MKILVLHSDVPPDAPPEDEDTLIAAAAVEAALKARGFAASRAAYRKDRAALAALLDQTGPDIVFNLVEGIDGLGRLAPQAPRALAALGWRFTGVGAAAMDLTNDKPRSKALLRSAGLATPDWSVAPNWDGLDDGCVVSGRAAVMARAGDCAARFGGDWFAEAFVAGREFNIAMLDGKVLPMAEMRFERWPEGKPRIVGYDAKWEEDSSGWNGTVRHFGVEREEPQLATRLREACERVWRLFELTGFARVDFRIDEAGTPLILEINANPCISPDAGFAAAAAEAGLGYDAVIEALVRAA